MQNAAAPALSAQAATRAAVVRDSSNVPESKMASNVQNGRPEVSATPPITPRINIDAVRAHLALMEQAA